MEGGEPDIMVDPGQDSNNEDQLLKERDEIEIAFAATVDQCKETEERISRIFMAQELSRIKHNKHSPFHSLARFEEIRNKSAEQKAVEAAFWPKVQPERDLVEHLERMEDDFRKRLKQNEGRLAAIRQQAVIIEVDKLLEKEKALQEHVIKVTSLKIELQKELDLRSQEDSRYKELLKQKEDINKKSQDTIDKLQKELQDARDEKLQVDMIKQQLGGLLSDAQARYDDLYGKKVQMVEDISGLEEHLNKAHEEIAARGSKIEEMLRAGSSMTEELQKERLKRSKAESDASNIQQELGALRVEMSRLQIEMSAKNETLKKELHDSGNNAIRWSTIRCSR